ncbi:MAG: hypothetical protein ONB46_15290 [candidate division KSB1 bacterium]|nr:hypothetical protein [candidate division KSB1 bacterium]MDZ7367082.1 hypothetical protein [candidate division KSB1 bacterium]MDZ7405060.1 hypothetical protein [candidate division KSB1 bacterium]
MANDIAVIARRNGKTAPAYLKARMVEALMADIATDVLAHADFSSDKQIEKALQSVRGLSDELIRAIAQFRYDAKRRRLVNKLRRANTEGALTATENDVFSALIGKEHDFSIVKAIALLEARRRGLKIRRFSGGASVLRA